MADDLKATKYYRNLGGVNLKASLYEMSPYQFLNIRNMDFDVPNALQQRPGSTFGSTNTLSGPVLALAEFEKLSGESWIIAHDSTALWFRGANNGFTTLATTGWSLSQPPDMQVFNNKLFAVNGNTALTWDGSTVYPLGLPCPKTTPTFIIGAVNGVSFFIFGIPVDMNLTVAPGLAIFAAYSYVRGDGYFGPVDFLSFSKNIASQQLGNPANGANVSMLIISGLTAPANQGITAIALWLGFYQFTAGNAKDVFGLVSNSIDQLGGGNYVPSQTLDTGQFYLYTLLSVSGKTATINFGGADFSLINFTNNSPFSGMAFCWFNTNTPKYMEINQSDCAVYAGFSNDPSQIWISDVGNPETIELLPADEGLINSFRVRTNNGDVVRGIRLFNNQTLIFKERSFHTLIGDSFQNYQVVPITTEYGCLSNKSIVGYKEYLLWLDIQGIVEFNGTSHDIISTPVEPIFRRMNVSAAREKACSVHYKARNQIWFGIPIDGSTENNITVVFDYFVKAWTFFDGFNASAFEKMRGGLTNETAWRGDYSGHVYYHGPSFYTDGGNAFTCLVLTRFESLGEENTNLWRRFFLDVGPISGGNILMKCFSNYNTTAVQFTAPLVHNVYQTRVELGIEAKSVAVEFATNSASFPLLVNGYAFAARKLRNV